MRVICNIRVQGRDPLRVTMRQFGARDEMKFNREIRAAVASIDEEDRGSQDDAEELILEAQMRALADRIEAAEGWSPWPAEVSERLAWLDEAGAAVIDALVSHLRPRAEDGVDLGKSQTGAT